MAYIDCCRKAVGLDPNLVSPSRFRCGRIKSTSYPLNQGDPEAADDSWRQRGAASSTLYPGTPEICLNLCGCHVGKATEDLFFFLRCLVVAEIEFYLVSHVHICVLEVTR